jgi:integrase
VANARVPSLIRIDDLSLLRPTKSRPYWRVKGVLPNGHPLDTTAGTTQVAAIAKAKAEVEKARKSIAPGAARHIDLLYRDILVEFVKPENHERWGRNGGARHAADTKAALYNHVLPILGNKLCQHLRPSDFRKILQSMRAEGYSGYTIQRVGSSMRATVTFMRNERYIEQNYDPMRGVSYQANSLQNLWVPHDERPTLAHKDALATGMGDLGGEAWWLATQIAGLCGPRWGELLYLTPESFDTTKCTINIDFQWNEHSAKQPNGISAKGEPGGAFVKALPKGGKPRVITYPAWMNDYLLPLFETVEKRHRQTFQQSGRSKNPMRLLFCTGEGTIPRRSSWNRSVITPARAAAQWPSDLAPVPRMRNGAVETVMSTQYRWSWHSLRHVFCSLTISTGDGGYGLDVAEGARLAGHSLQVFMAKYVQPPDDFRERVSAVMAQQPAPPRRVSA